MGRGIAFRIASAPRAEHSSHALQPNARATNDGARARLTDTELVATIKNLRPPRAVMAIILAAARSERNATVERRRLDSRLGRSFTTL